MVTDSLSDKAVHSQLSYGKQAAALYPSITNDLHVSIATCLHEKMPLSSKVHQPSGPPTFMLLLRTLLRSRQAWVCVCECWCVCGVCVDVCVGVCVMCVLVVVVVCVVCVLMCVVVCVVVWHAENLRVQIQNVSVRAAKTPVSHVTRAFCRHTRRRFESTHAHTHAHQHTHEHRRKSNTNPSPPLPTISMNHYPWHTNHQHGPRVLSYYSNANAFTTSACMLCSQHIHDTYTTHPPITHNTHNQTDRQRETDGHRQTLTCTDRQTTGQEGWCACDCS